VLIHPVDEVPKTVLLAGVVPKLSALLAEYGIAHPRNAIRLRAVMHAGEVHYDGRGCYGEALDLAFRLLDAPETRQALNRTREPLALVVSDEIYRSLVRHGYAGIDVAAFEPLAYVELANERHLGWMHIPACPSPAR
jgi:hypothetical protein